MQATSAPNGPALQGVRALVWSTWVTSARSTSSMALVPSTMRTVFRQRHQVRTDEPEHAGLGTDTILGLIELTAGFSLIAGNAYGRVIGIIAGSLGAIGALLSVGGNNPWWSLAVFALCVFVVHGIVVFGEDERGDEEPPRR